ncbi:MAG TPA: amidohydrolase family protein [Burkholderiaceae bacterium]
MSAPERHWFPLTGDDAPDAAAPLVGRRATPIDALSGPTIALAGRIVTMDDAFDVLPDGVLYIAKGRIVATLPRSSRPPSGFETTPVTPTGGTLFPGFIELHNHLAYNVLPLWSPVPRLYQDRGQWPAHPDYRRLISGPMTVIGEYRDDSGRPALLAPLVRYVECKCLMGGCTTSQGIMLNSNAGVQRFFRGILRNVENTAQADLSDADARIADVDAKDARRFLARLGKEHSCFLLHLSEGITRAGQATSTARKHFLALEVAPDEWAINDTFAGIHAAGLLPQDFTVLHEHGGSMVWSPLSNLLLYGDTARVDAARAAHVPIGLGSDWSPSGSKNLLGEMKVAWLYSHHVLDDLFSPRDIVAMVTRDAAAILKWQPALGTLEAGKHADVCVVDGIDGDPYDALIHAPETAIRLVMIEGVARFGEPALMHALHADGEARTVGGQPRTLFLADAEGDPDVDAVSLASATSALAEALHTLPALARALETPHAPHAARLVLDAARRPAWTLALDEIRDDGIDMRPRLPYAGPSDFTGPAIAAPKATSPPLSALLGAIELDPLTVADDPDFLGRIAAEPNVPTAIRDGLALLY